MSYVNFFLHYVYRGSYLDNGKYEEFTLVSSDDCNRLFSIGEYDAEFRKMACFCNLFKRYPDPQKKF